MKPNLSLVKVHLAARGLCLHDLPPFVQRHLGVPAPWL